MGKVETDRRPKPYGWVLGRILPVTLFWAALWGCVPYPQAPPSQEVMTVSEEVSLQSFVQRRGGEFFDAELAAEIRLLGRSLSQRSRRPDLLYEFTVLDRTSPELHVFSDSQILLTRGLLAGAADAGELEGLLAFAVSEADVVAPAPGHRQISSGALPPRKLSPSETKLTAHQSARLSGILSGLHATRQGYDLYEQARQIEEAGRLSAAIGVYLQAATAAPDQPRILTGLGLAYLQAGDLQSARIHLQRAVRLQPAYYLSRMGLGYVELQLGRLADAIVELERSVELLPMARNKFLLAESYQKSGQPSASIPLYRAVTLADGNGKLGRMAAQRLQELEK